MPSCRDGNGVYRDEQSPVVFNLHFRDRARQDRLRDVAFHVLTSSPVPGHERRVGFRLEAQPLDHHRLMIELFIRCNIRIKMRDVPSDGCEVAGRRSGGSLRAGEGSASSAMRAGRHHTRDATDASAHGQHDPVTHPVDGNLPVPRDGVEIRGEGIRESDRPDETLAEFVRIAAPLHQDDGALAPETEPQSERG